MVAFQVCFWLGVIVTLVNFILGAFFDILDFGLDLDVDLHIGSLDFGAFLPASPSLGFMMLTIFGGTGLVLHRTLPMWAVVLIGLGLGFLATYLVNRFVVRPLRRISEKESGGRADFIGLPAKVTEKIFENGFGKITFTYDDNIITAPAKTMDGKALPVGTQVVVLEIDRQVYKVERLV